MPGSPIDPRDLRVSDDERSHVLSLLEKATGRGLIDLAEYTRRSADVIAAKTRGEVNAVLIDLPGPGYSGAPLAAAGSGVLELTGWGTRSFRGHWLAPAHIVISGFGAST